MVLPTRLKMDFSRWRLLSELYFFKIKEIIILGRQLQKRVKLENGARIVIIGGGPPGSFFAIHLLREAEKANLDINVTIVDKGMEPMGDVQQFKGCCAGIISPRLQKELAKYGLTPPRELICEKFTHIWMHGPWKNFPLKVPPGQELISLFRKSLPCGREGSCQGFDPFILEKALEKGAEIITGEATAINYTLEKRPVLTIKPAWGDPFEIKADFACITTGVNPDHGKKYKENSLVKSYRMINPMFKPPETRAAFIFELKPGQAYLKKYMDKELYIIVSGSKELKLDHILLIPKKEYLTVALTGKAVDRASSPEEKEEIIKTFLSLPHIQKILPHITLKNTPVSCRCSPHMVVDPSRKPFSDRIAMAGDALGARLYRDGLFSAFISAKALAKTVVHKGIDKKSLEKGYGWVEKWLRNENLYGKLIFGLIRMALKSPFLSRVFYQTFATEMKFKKKEKWPLGTVLWKIGSDSADYRKIFKDLISAPVFLSILRGSIKTFRNILTELFFGLNWEDHGRYPTVIIREKRDYFKESISAPLKIKLDPVPEMERMYAIKIRSSGERVFKELGKFGDPGGKLLRLRFVDVRRVAGLPNQEGAVVQYRLKMIPVSMDIRLIKAIPERSLLYEPAEIFTKRGKLLFDISPTRDGNSRLVIYTAFDFRKGKGTFGRIFWKLFKALFPDYAHDVVWNHAICAIKEAAERNDNIDHIQPEAQ